MTKVRTLLFTALAVVLACGICGQQALAQEDLADGAQGGVIAIGHIPDASPDGTPDASAGMYQGIVGIGPNPPASGDWPCFAGWTDCTSIAAGGLVIATPNQVVPKSCSKCGQIYFTYETTTATGTATHTITVTQGSPAKTLFHHSITGTAGPNTIHVVWVSNVSLTGGFLSFITYQVNDQFGLNTYQPDQVEAGQNELLGTATASPQHPDENWGAGTEKGSNTLGGVFQDHLCRTDNSYRPSPQPPPQGTLSTDLVVTIPQTFYAGGSANPPPNQGCIVQTDTINLFIDHGTHSYIVSPAAAPLPASGSVVADAPSARSGTSHPEPLPPNVWQLEEQATVIVKGRVLEVSEVGTVKKQALTFHDMRASFQVDSVLKGKVDANVITVEFSDDPDLLDFTLSQNEYVLLFLTSRQNGRYTFANPQVSSMPITRRNVPLAEAAQTTAGKLEAELFASLSDPDRKVARTALDQVGSLPHVRSTQAIRDIATLGAPDFQGLAYIALLKLRDYSLWDRAVRFAEQPVQDPELQRLQFGVAGAIGDIKDKSVVPALSSLLASPAVILRRAAASALREIGDPSSARFLVRALDDSDHDVQYDAMMGLGALVRYSHDAPDAPYLGLFHEDPAKYLGAWKSWWEASGKQKFESSR